MSEFTPMSRPQHLPARIAAALSLQIREGALKPGDRLPTELALTRSFAVSRTVVREAIAQLRNEGLIETRQGAGAFVIQRPARHIRLEDGRMEPHAFRDLFQLRLPLEIEAAGLAATHHGPEHLEQLDAALARMAAPDASGDDVMLGDLDFHRAIAAATGNAYFVQFLGAISDRILHTIIDSRARARPEEIGPQVEREHRALRAAIAARDPVSAREAMRAHMLGSAERVALRLQLYG